MPYINCPACKGKKKYEYTTISGYVRIGTCTACKGTGKLELTEAAYQRHLREIAKPDKRKKYKSRLALKPEEIQIIGEFKTIRQTLDDLATAGFVRSRASINQVRYQIRQGGYGATQGN